MVRISRRLRLVGWIMMVWSGSVMVFGCIFGRPVLLVFYPLLFVMGWQATATVRNLRAASKDEAAVLLVRGYLRQSWLVLAWILLGLVMALYLGIAQQDS